MEIKSVFKIGLSVLCGVECEGRSLSCLTVVLPIFKGNVDNNVSNAEEDCAYRRPL